ncbi:MAG TPA: PilZ domain-containing protein [Syntrophales bacterium]|nr:PilZ domain-containing protein [Syntrophales bacterium]
MKEKRKFNRYDVDVNVTVEINDRNGLVNQFHYKSKNLAAGGVLIASGKCSIPNDTELKLKINFQFERLKTIENPEGVLIMFVTGRVIRHDPEGTVICFYDDCKMSQCLDFLRENNN